MYAERNDYALTSNSAGSASGKRWYLTAISSGTVYSASLVTAYQA
jgi:hypothetical protein